LVAAARFARRFGVGLRGLTFDLGEGFEADLAERLEAALDFFSADLGRLARDLTLALFEVLARRRDGIALIIPAEEVLSRGKSWSNQKKGYRNARNGSQPNPQDSRAPTTTQVSPVADVFFPSLLHGGANTPQPS
jgi:hypothetical protein